MRLVQRCVVYGNECGATNIATRKWCRQGVDLLIFEIVPAINDEPSNDAGILL